MSRSSYETAWNIRSPQARVTGKIVSTGWSPVPAPPPLIMLTTPGGTPASRINSISRAPGLSKLDAVGRVVASVTSHEIGHMLGCWHTRNDDNVICLMDQGGDLLNTAGVSWGFFEGGFDLTCYPALLGWLAVNVPSLLLGDALARGTWSLEAPRAGDAGARG